MAHLNRILSDAVLIRGYITLGIDLAKIDTNIFKALNGDKGGTWSPTSSITIAGKGVVVAGPGPWTMSGTTVKVTTGPNKPILFGKGDKTDYFGIATGHVGAAFSTFVRFIESFTKNVGVKDDSTTGVLTTVPGVRFFTPLRVFSGAPKIDSVQVVFLVLQAHASVPQYLPKMRVIAVSVDGTVTPLRTADSTTDSDGFKYFPTPVSGAAWYNGGAIQTFTYTCNVIKPVDVSTYSYFVEFVDESGTGSFTTTGNLYYGATVAYSAVSLFDGRT